jgi:hypothetical protein
MTFDEKVMMELILQGPNSALAGLTAATLDGLQGFPSKTLFVVAPHQGRIRNDLEWSSSALGSLALTTCIR